MEGAPVTDKPLITADPWAVLRNQTPARIGLGRSGRSMPTKELLAFSAAHAQARDAVHLPLQAEALAAQLADLFGEPTLQLRSAAPDRSTYLLRPDLGRRLSDESRALLSQQTPAGCDLLLIVGDGLSAAAVERQAMPMLAALLATKPKGWRLGPPVLATQARVALGDEIGERLAAAQVAMLIGERPGLSSPDSLGVYLTHAPKVGRTDAERNCLSNVRPEGLSHAEAARKLWWLGQAARRLQLTGVGLKDHSDIRALS
ncbi:ethanolamine ammonia-lyase subunit EutC [Ideonella azotifigens]|uniref:Ethanolamine ammonia-lyase small subunit n=1 Tax=Ideonella azotifigens TaxID=513160 RepID=A0ABN1JUA2_9BURK